MLKIGFTSFIICLFQFTQAQHQNHFDFNKEFSHVSISKVGLSYDLSLKKGTIYQVRVLQEGIDVALTLTDEHGQKVMEKDSPNGKFGPELFEYTPLKNGNFTLSIQRFEEEGNTDSGEISFYVKQFTPAEVTLHTDMEKALQSENAGNILTADIDHFWEAYDQLKNAKTHYDSLTAIQNLYLDRATDGLKDFIQARDFSAEGYLSAFQNNPGHYESIRPNTAAVKTAAPLIQEVFDSLKSIYPDFKPFKVCFAIGMMRTGGTTSDRFVLIGTELMATGEITKLPQRIKGLIAHECIHTQQKDKISEQAIGCNQLWGVLREGMANFLGEMITGTTNYNEVNTYGNLHETALWEEFKATLCYPSYEKWMYNGDTSKDRPADLGYYIGYKIVQTYYENAPDKKKAIAEIIEMDDPVMFLHRSGYDRKKKNQ